jgi:hypothetical protein
MGRPRAVGPSAGLQRIAYPFGGSLVKARLVGVERKASRICIANQLSTLHWLMLRAVANVNLFILTPIQFWFQSNEVRFMKSIPRIGCSLLLAVLVLPTTASLAQSVAQTPPMGWNSWNYFAGKVDDKGIRAAADQIAASGMKDAGYVYVNIDDTWEAGRDANGVIQTNAKFPDMKALADYVHSKGLKIGIYSGPGNKTCAGYTASLGHEEQDAKTYAGWGIDYLKYDLCSFIPDVMQKQAPHDKAAQMKLMTDAYEKMGKALKSDCVLALPVRLGCAMGVGSGARRQLVADHRGHRGTLAEHLRYRQPAIGTGEIRGPRPLERSGHAGGRERQAFDG